VNTTIVWNGAAELRDSLAPVEGLNPAPFNVRRGDLQVIGDSLRRFGQFKPIVTAEDGTILAGNNVYLCAVELMGWSHVAVVEIDGLSDDDKMLLLLADNQSHDVGKVDPDSALTVRSWLRARADSAEVSDETGALLRAAADLLERDAHRAEGREFGVIDGDLLVECRCGNCGYEFDPAAS
jgi:hypothetical protein